MSAKLQVQISFPGVAAPRFFVRLVSVEGLSIENLQAAVDESVRAFNETFTAALERMRSKGIEAPERAA